MGLRVIVQSERDAAYLETRVNAFWEGYKKTLDAMSEEDFTKYKTTVSNTKLEDHKNMWQESVHHTSVSAAETDADCCAGRAISGSTFTLDITISCKRSETPLSSSPSPKRK